MGSTQSQKGKDGYAVYKAENRANVHKESHAKQLERHLAHRKSWRIQKYGLMPQIQLSTTTVTLFRRWAVPLVGPKKTKGQKVQEKRQKVVGG